MSDAAVLHPRAVILDVLPGDRVRDAIAIVVAVALTALSAQLVVPLPFSPVPITGQTFAVLLTAAALGPARAVTAQGIYLALGATGLPFYAEARGGVDILFGATGGYLFGFVLAAALVGALARRGLDRRVTSTAVAFLVGSVVIYLVGAPWLAVVGGFSASEAWALGVEPFLVGDLVKAGLAGAVLPGAWRLLRRS